ncbi:MAG TPA: phosphoribosyl-ATP diphosphatase [Pirellulales bacterium]|nr:phosphoribosyl-ATP diphosphatase [Pirellulales bacterium]
MNGSETTFAKLMETILERKARPSEKSYTSQLLAGGAAKIRKKIVEESAEIFEAAGEPGDEGRRHVINEASDLIYHLFVLLADRGIALADVEQELARRFGISGLAEKAGRGKMHHGGAEDTEANELKS